MFGITDIRPLPIRIIADRFTMKSGAGISPINKKIPAKISIIPKIVKIITVTGFVKN